MAGSPNIAISPAKKTKSKTAKTINRLPNDGVKSNFPLSLRRNHTLKMFTSTPNVATTFCKYNALRNYCHYIHLL